MLEDEMFVEKGTSNTVRCARMFSGSVVGVFGADARLLSRMLNVRVPDLCKEVIILIAVFFTGVI